MAILPWVSASSLLKKATPKKKTSVTEPYLDRSSPDHLTHLTWLPAVDSKEACAWQISSPQNKNPTFGSQGSLRLRFCPPWEKETYLETPAGQNSSRGLKKAKMLAGRRFPVFPAVTESLQNHQGSIKHSLRHMVPPRTHVGQHQKTQTHNHQLIQRSPCKAGIRM